MLQLEVSVWGSKVQTKGVSRIQRISAWGLEVRKGPRKDAADAFETLVSERGGLANK